MQMKKVSKILSVTLGTLLLVIIMLFAIAKLKENEIAAMALQKISESIKAPLVVGDISLSLLRKFPLATIEFKDVRLGFPDALSLTDAPVSKEKTLASIEKVFISVKSIPLFRGEFDIMKVEIKSANFSYIVDTQGASNVDFLLDAFQKDTADSDTTSLSLNVMLKELLLRDIHCNYYDSLNLISAQLIIPKAKVNGEIKNDYLQGSANGVLKFTNCNYKTSPLHFMNETEINFDADYSGDSVDVKELIIVTDGANFNINGSVVIKDTIETNITISGTKINIGELIKYAPQQTLDSIGIKKVSGMLYLEASIHGLIADSILPEVKMEVEMKNGSIQTTGYPSLQNISFAGFLTNGKMRNNETTGIYFRKFHAETGQSNIDMSFSLNNFDRINYSINSEIDINLGDFKEYIPDTIISEASGQILASISTKGVLPDSIGNDFIDYLLETSRVKLTLNNLFIAPDTTLTLDSLSGQFDYELNHVTVRDLHVNVPTHKININNTSFDANIYGKPSQPATVGIDLKSYRINTDSSAVYGFAKIHNLTAPEFDITSIISLNLSEISTFLPDSLVNKLTGEITAQITSGGKLNPDSIPD
ncbi:MAG: AsmA family protein, partial [Alphaproteobacteria bacterium]